jgi:hypothetical protein
MEIGLMITSTLLIAFGVLALIDGFYLHIFKYQLHNHAESKTEHLTHTIRAILFPAIMYFLFLKQNCEICFYIGILLAIIDVIVLAIDAYTEKDSRAFIGGLPRWEYILHLFVNGFHFSSIAVFLTIKLNFSENNISIVADLSNVKSFAVFEFIVINLIPGAILLACIHIFIIFKPTVAYWNNWRAQINCC